VLRNRHFAARQALVPALLIPIHPVQGDVTYQIRPDNPRVMKGEKVRYETPARQPNRIDAHPFIKKHLGDPSVRLFITEGVRKADALVSKDECCIALLGVWNWKGTNAAGGKTVLPDFDDIAWNDRKVYIVFDSDARTKPGVQRATVRLKDVLGNRGADVHGIRLPAARDGSKQGLDDYLAAGHTVDDLMELVETEQEAQASAKPPSQATQLMELGRKLYRFGRSFSDESFAVSKSGPNVARSLRFGGSSLRAELAKHYAREHGSVPTQTALTNVFNVFDGWCLEQPAEELAVRMGRHNDSVIIDMGDDAGRAIAISRDGWQVLPQSPVLFRRSELTNPLPEPTRGGSIDDARRFFNMDDQSWVIFKGFLVASMMPGFPHPILLIRGQQGSAKSTSAKMLVELADPSPSPLRAVPRSQDDFAIMAAGSCMFAMDNLSFIPEWLSDALCRAVTGDAWIKRANYTDGGLSVHSYQRTIVLTAIDVGAMRGDLADRILPVDLEPIPKRQRKEEKVLLADFYAARPRILGSLLDLVAETMKAMGATRPTELPRMADFGRVLAAMDHATGTNAFQTYLQMTDTIAIEVTEGDEVAQALKSWVSGDVKTYSDTATGWLRILTNQTERPSKFWPATPQHLSGRLKRLAPNLKLIGLEIEFGRAGKEGTKAIVVRRVDPAQTRADDEALGHRQPPSAEGGHRQPKRDQADDADDETDEIPYPSLLASEEEKGQKGGEERAGEVAGETDVQTPSAPSAKIKSAQPTDSDGLRKIVGWAAAKSETR
jgi:hypothetical protein